MVDTPGKVTLWGIEVFLAAAEEQSISAAAKRLGASPSAVSQQITNLEAALGAELLDRSARPLALTPAGALFLRRARAILNEAAEARAELAMADLSRLTRVNLGMIEDFDADVTPRLLADMAGELRHTRFLLETGASHRLMAKLEARALDMVVAADLGGARPDWAEVHPLLSEPFIAAVPTGVGEVGDVMRSMPFVQYTERHLMGRQIAAHLAREGVAVEHRFELDSYHAIMAMVAEGAGWTILTPLGYLRAGRFRDRAEVHPLPFAPLSRTIQLSARAGVFQDLPARVAGELRGLLEELIVGPATERMPWLAGDLKVL
ncbi:MAG: LysR family transcriptional regulator [Paracoccaceae bacterium]|nr:LysR family transcriptional regulator [Paracoccaceae bacterium]